METKKVLKLKLWVKVVLGGVLAMFVITNIIMPTPSDKTSEEVQNDIKNTNITYTENGWYLN